MNSSNDAAPAKARTRSVVVDLALLQKIVLVTDAIVPIDGGASAII
ncbi:MAG TPA: hypothetical protein VGL25_15805 [Casimicrobiaceae bacterium]